MQTSTDMAVRLRISGRVQGVFFRAWTREQAHRLGLCGWVRNRRDGTVEALIAGPAAAVGRMVALCHEGPPQARVAHVESMPASMPAATSFEIRPTV